MRRPHIVRGAGAVAVALALSACSAPEPEVTPPASVVAERLVELGTAADAFSGVAVGRQAITARAVKDSTLQFWDLSDGVRPVTDAATNSAAVPFEELDPGAVQEQVAQLAKLCEASEFRVSVDVVTPSAMLGELRCGDDTFEGLTTHDPVAVRLNGSPLPSSMAVSVEETWQVVLDLLAELDPGLGVGSLSIDADTISLELSDGAATQGCRPALVFERDGSDVTNACRRTGQKPAISLAGFTAANLARLQLEAMEQAGIIGTDRASVSVDSSARLEPQLRVRQGSSEATVAFEQPRA
ncbi:hypothetical protein SAMN02745244_01666 [Tessaracoccus bendigoensis DSM 12906]|uniref:Lipoprotein n=1 Tax=Tessaracoccus bendigoensis DSM 12906 TaxID=1123357 RepID=A0A1M6GCZ8_9ACTN|nr:hypothetical protein [Tessaracoccus bendigoensis]SHJ07828.1 hypothetical protein SAMN02745244_01666 [Tessaracoccus bendigoensis DSM 12906]